MSETQETIAVAAAEPAPAAQAPAPQQQQQQQREDFTSEAFKVEIRNISNYGFGEIKKFLRTKCELNPVKIKAQARQHFAYLCFRSEEERTLALAKLDGCVWKGKTIKATPAAAVADPMAQKRQQRDRNVDSAPKRTVLEATAPLAHLPYADQLTRKESDLRDVLRSYGTQAHRLNRSLRLRDRMSATDSGGLPCRWLGLRPAPQPAGYRNKAEFTVGRNASGERVVGFRLGSYADGSVEVDTVDALPHLPERMKLAASAFQTFVRQSPLAVFSPEFYTGVWRQLMVRVSHATGAVMLVIGVHTQPLAAAELDALRADLRRWLTESAEGVELGAASVYLEHVNKREAGERGQQQQQQRVEHLHGATHIEDSIRGLRFRISPEAFFQVNTPAAEVLYGAAIELAACGPRTTVLDVCCGTGTIALCFAAHCERVRGVEIVPQAIEDARCNAVLNGVENAEFVAGNCDDWIRKFVYEHEQGVKAEGAERAEKAAAGAEEKGGAVAEVVAIIDPPRAGLHVKSIASLRSSKGLDRFVYISCAPKAALRNWVDLARPSSKAYRGEPFVVTAACGVDMFPHTHHTEMVLLFERVKAAPEGEQPKEEAMEVGEVEEEAKLAEEDVRVDEVATETESDSVAVNVAGVDEVEVNKGDNE